MSSRWRGYEDGIGELLDGTSFILRSDISMRNEHSRDPAVAAENSQELCVEGRMRLRSTSNPNICFVGALFHIEHTRYGLYHLCHGEEELQSDISHLRRIGRALCFSKGLHRDGMMLEVSWPLQPLPANSRLYSTR